MTLVPLTVVTRGRRAAAPPRYLFIETTTECNLACKHCHMWLTKEPAGTLTTPEKLALVEEFGRWSPGGVVVLTGGEPFRKPDEVMALSRCARAAGLSTAANTNGTLVPRELFADLLTTGPRYLVVSLDSPDPEVFDRLRGRKGVHAQVSSLIADLVEERRRVHPSTDVRVLVNAIVCRTTLPGLLELARSVRSLGADGIMFQALGRTFMNQGTGDPFFDAEIPRDLGETDRLLDALIEQRNRDRFIQTDARDLEWMKLYFRNPDFISEPVCGSADRNMMVSMYGEIQLCFAMKQFTGGEPVARTRSSSLRAAWEGESAAGARVLMDSCRRNCGMLHCHRREPGR